MLKEGYRFVAGVLQECYRCVAGMLQEYYKCVERVLQGFTGVVQGFHREHLQYIANISPLLADNFKILLVHFQVVFYYFSESFLIFV